LRDLSDRRLFASGSIDMQRYSRLHPHVTGRINRPRILDWWDDMVRVAGSMKLGWVTASLLVQKLQAHPQQNALAAALQEYGRWRAPCTLCTGTPTRRIGAASGASSTKA